jgi:hypothetical protein
MSFKSVQKKIAGQGHSMASAGAILASASRHASAAAKRANPKLKRVKGKMHSGGVVPEDGLYEMKKGEKVVPSGHADLAIKYECVEAFPNSPEASGTGHYEIDGNSVKFVKG